MSMHDKLANLHILLRAKSFERWPLKVRFFAEDVYKMWHRWTTNMPEKIRQGIEIEMDQSILDQQKILNEDPLQPIGIHTIDPTYQHVKATLERSQKLLAAPQNFCNICRSDLDPKKEMALVCLNDKCNTVFHVACLSNNFLNKNATNAIVPTNGDCPSCKTRTNWTDLVKDLSLRIRGEKEVAALFKEPKRRKKNSKEDTSNVAAADEEEMEHADQDDVLAEESDDEVDIDDVLLQADYEDVEELQATPADDDRKVVDEFDDQATTGAALATTPMEARKIVIEDSDWDEAEVID